MGELDQCVVGWSGFQGAPGYSVFYAHHGPGGVRDKIQNFFNSVKPQLPSTVRIQVPNSGAVIEETTGETTGLWTDTTLPAIIGGAGGKYSAATGCCITWNTSTFLTHGRLRGRTFLVPLESGCFAPDGSLDDGTRTLLQAAADLLVVDSDENLVIWHRPTSPGATNGSSGIVVSATIRDRTAVLTSRRPR